MRRSTPAAPRRTTPPPPPRPTWRPLHRSLRTAVAGVTAALALTLGALVAPVAATAEPSPLVTTAGTTWSYLDDNTDPAAGSDDRTSWTAPELDDSAWKQATGPFGAKDGAGGGLGSGFPVNTVLEHYIDGASNPTIPAYFFRTSFEVDAEDIAQMKGLSADLVHDDAVTVYLNGERVAGFEDGAITANLDYGGSPLTDPRRRTFTIPATVLDVGTNVLAVELHNVNDTSSDIYLDVRSLTPVPVDTTTVISDLVLTVGSDESSRSVAWYSTTDSAQAVQVAPVAALDDGAFPADAATFDGSGALSADLQFFRHATITGLEPSTRYAYRVGSDDSAWSETFELTTGAFEGDYSFVYVGDPQVRNADNGHWWQQSLDQAFTTRPDARFIVSGGDQVEAAGNEEHYEILLGPDQLRQHAFAPTIGNHDNEAILFREHFALPNIDEAYGAAPAGESGGNYWYTYQDVLFMHLNVNNRDNANHLEFVEKIIDEQGADARWKVVVFHHSVYSVGNHTNSSDIRERRRELPPGLSALGVNLVLMGHDHSYTRTYLMDGTSVVAGTGGDVLTPREGEVLYVTANTSSTSKFYGIRDQDFLYAAVTNQENVPNYSTVDVTDEALTITTYRTTDRSVVDAVRLEAFRDETAPTLTVPDATVLEIGEAFDPLAGVSAHDDRDGDLTDAVTVAGSVDPAAAGTYVLTYAVQDAAGNEATARQVVVVTASAGPGGALDVVVAPRCTAGRAVLAVRATNLGASASDVTIETDHGRRSVAGVVPGSSASQTFATRSTTLDAGSVSITGIVELPGTRVTTTYDVEHAGIDCS